MPDHPLADGGEREAFEGGAVREPNDGRGRWDLIPYEPMMRLAQHYENGAKKYGDRNWESGIPASGCVRSILRHTFQWMWGCRKEDHLAAIAWNAFAIMFMEEHHKKMIDTPITMKLEG